MVTICSSSRMQAEMRCWPLPSAHLSRHGACITSGRILLTRTAAITSARWQRHAVVCASGRSALHLFSPAKINVFLRVVRRREDGYHDLASLFHVIDLGDDMDFELLPAGASRDELTCDMPGVPTDDTNLVVRAFDLFRSKTGAKQHFRVDMRKRVPHGAGMGGGSGNAATALWAANELCGRPASTAQLLQWSGNIGSDISMFFSEGAAYCTGRGEIVENVQPPLPLATPLLLVKPPVALATPEIFKALDLSRRSTADPLALLEGLRQEGATQSLCVNDLEQPAFDRLPALAELKGRLQEEGGFSTVFMTGSGSTIVCVGSDVPPTFLAEARYGDLFVSPARLIVRRPGEWYEAPALGSHSGAAAAAAAASVAA